MNGSVLYMDSGINRGRGDATPRPPARGRADFHCSAGSFSLTFSRGEVPAVIICGHVTLFRHQPEGIYMMCTSGIKKR